VEKYGTAGQATEDNITRRMRIACWINNATDSHSEYVKLTAFPRRLWLRESASMLCLHLVVHTVTSVLQMVKYYIPTTYDMIACRSHSARRTEAHAVTRQHAPA
jgi:hypothetical protein